MTGERQRQKTPMFEALHSDRYQRQDLIRQIQEMSGANLLCYVAGGPDSNIDRWDAAYFNDLLYGIDTDTDIDLLLHTPGGDIDAAEKMMSLLWLRVGAKRLRVVVPDFAKSAGTLMAIAGDVIVMSDTSELGPIDPQAVFVDGDGTVSTRSVLSYLASFSELSARLQKDADDQVAQLLLAKFDPDRLFFFRKLIERTRLLAEAHLRRGMCRETGAFTSIGAKLLDVEHFGTHGKPISADEALGMGLTVRRVASSDPYWDCCWRLFCLQRLAVKNGQKLFESERASVISGADS